jgi:hypothetical protein
MPKQQRRRGQVQKRNALFVTHVGLDNFEEDGRKTGWLLCAEYSSSGVPSNRLCISTMPADCQLRSVAISRCGTSSFSNRAPCTRIDQR